MAFPGFSGPVHDMTHAEARRKERRERLSRFFGREIDRRSRLIVGAVFAVLLIAAFVLVVLGW